MVTLQGPPQQGATQQGSSPPIISLQSPIQQPNNTYQGSYQLGMTPQGTTQQGYPQHVPFQGHSQENPFQQFNSKFQGSHQQGYNIHSSNFQSLNPQDINIQRNTPYGHTLSLYPMVQHIQMLQQQTKKFKLYLYPRDTP